MHQTIKIYPPLLGAMLDIEQVPDIVFSEKIVGNGIAIDPLNSHIYSPVTGVIKSIHKAKHAITVTSIEGVDVLIHIGLETVNLNGNGFKIFISDGDKVKSGDMLGEFDMDYVVQSAKTLISPIVLVDLKADNYKMTVIHKEFTQLGEPIIELQQLGDLQLDNDKSQNTSLLVSKPIKILNSHGIHARPAAVLSSKAKEFDCDIFLEKNGKFANLKSVVALLGLAVNMGDNIRIHAQTQEQIEELTKIINNLADEVDAVKDSSIKKVNLNLNRVEGNIYYGITASSGISVGKLFMLNKSNIAIDELSTDIEVEKLKFKSAIESVKTNLEVSIASNQKNSKSAVLEYDILSAHLVLLTDPDILNETVDLIKQGKTAGFSISHVIEKNCKVLDATKNQLLIDRKADLRDIRNRILTAMNPEVHDDKIFNESTILLAEEFTPADILNLNKMVVGLVAIEGGTTSHVAILAKSRGIPLLVGVNKNILTHISRGVVILDTRNSMVNLQPSVDEVALSQQALEDIKQKHQINHNHAKEVAVTVDGVEIKCLGNIANVGDSVNLHDNGADGVGLFRTEFMYLERDSAPTVEDQYLVYAHILNNIHNDQPFIIRTLDAGGEKQIAYLNMPHEINPVLGIRGIRFSLIDKELFSNQLEAILKLNQANVKIMLPMITTIEEYRSVKELYNGIAQKLNINCNIELGIMVEVPSVALMSDIFAKEVAFFSIGTNDLTQYTLAIDRESMQLASQLDHLHPAVLRNIDLVVKGAAKYNRPVSVCGLMASEVLALPVLIGLGVESLSMNINMVSDNKAFIRKLSYAKCREDALKCINFATALEVREFLTQQYKEFLG